MKKLITIVMFACIAFLAGCNMNSNEEVKIGVSISSNDTWLMTMRDAMEARADELGDIDVVYTDARDDPSIQIAQVENFITQGFDAIIVNPVNTDATDPITELVVNAGIDLVYVNRKPRNLPDGTYYIGSDERIAGNLQGKYVADKLKNKKGDIGILQGILGLDSTRNRTKGAKEILAPISGLNVTREQTGRFMRDLGMSVTENWINAGNELIAIISNNDEMAIGAVSALEANNMKDNVLVIGIDATPDALAFIKDGRLDATIFQDAKGQGAGSIDAAYKLAKKQHVEKEIWIPFELVTKENYTDYL